MSIKIISGNIFSSKCETIVNTVNCVGVMGAGIAFEFKLRYPEMYAAYVDLCNKNQINIGALWLYRDKSQSILNFPTKTDWRLPSRIEYIQAGLEKFVSSYKEKNIQSIAFPILGGDRGGIPQKKSIDVMTKYLAKLDIDIEIYKYSPQQNDELYDKTKNWLLSNDPKFIADKTKVNLQYVLKIIDAVNTENFHQLNQLIGVKGIGIKTIEKIYSLASNFHGSNHEHNPQRSLF